MLVTGSRHPPSLKFWDAAALASGALDAKDAAPHHTIKTPRAPVFDVTFTKGNLCLAAGPLFDY